MRNSAYEFSRDGTVTETGRLRLPVDVNYATLNTLDDVAVILMMESRSDVVRTSLDLMRWSLNKIASGAEVMLCDPDSGQVTKVDNNYLEDIFGRKLVDGPDGATCVDELEKKRSVYDEDSNFAKIPFDFLPGDVHEIDRLCELDRSQSRSTLVQKSVILFVDLLPSLMSGKELIAVEPDDRILTPEFEWMPRLNIGGAGISPT